MLLRDAVRVVVDRHIVVVVVDHREDLRYNPLSLKKTKNINLELKS
jgi:hypothetical protein